MINVIKRSDDPIGTSIVIIGGGLTFLYHLAYIVIPKIVEWTWWLWV